jgi:hypothetical protein
MRRNECQFNICLFILIPFPKPRGKDVVLVGIIMKTRRGALGGVTGDATRIPWWTRIVDEGSSMSSG